MQVPKSWDDISIGQYIELRPVLLADMNDIERLIHLLAVLLKQPTQEIKKLKIEEYRNIHKDLKFLDSELPREVQNRFEINGKWYEIVLNANELNGGQYMSITSKLKDSQNDPEYVYNNLHEILASISIPVEKKRLGWKHLEIEPSYYKDTAEAFYKHLPMSIAYPIGVFFYNLSQSLMKSIQDYSNQKLTEAEKMKMEVMRDFLADGDGSLRSITYLMEILKSGSTSTK